MLKGFLNKLTNPLVSITLVLVIGVSVYLSVRGSDDLGFDFAISERGSLERTIDVTGRVEPVSSVDLAFENSGKINSVFVDIGDRVFANQTLVTQISSGISADLAQARARLKSEESKLEELKRGSRPEEIVVQEIKVSNAEINFDESKQALIDEIKSSFTKSDDAVRNKVDQFFSSPSTDNPKVTFTVSNFQYKNNAESGRIFIETVLNDWKTSVNSLSVESDLEAKAQEARNNIFQVQSFLETISILLNSLQSSSNLTQATIDGYKSDISTARTNMDTASISISTDVEGFRTDKASLNLAKEELILMEAGSDPQAILSQEAKVEEALANIQKFQSELDKRFIFSPISGLVTFIDVFSGEIVSANEVIVSVISDSTLEVVANIPETDIVEVGVGNSASVTLDAYSDDVVFGASVAKIDPAETIVDGVPVYKTTFVFNNPDQRIRSGMTADIDILIIKKENVLSVPRRAVFEKDNKEFIRVWDGVEITEREVETGFIGSDGRIEIISGLNEGENVITFVKDESILDK